jgi:hypothetical protein
MIVITQRAHSFAHTEECILHIIEEVPLSLFAWKLSSSVTFQWCAFLMIEQHMRGSSSS